MIIIAVGTVSHKTECRLGLKLKGLIKRNYHIAINSNSEEPIAAEENFEMKTCTI
jgi:hypothetical protein